MDRPSSSYFVTITGNENDLVLANLYMQDSGIVPDYLSLSEDQEPGSLTYEVEDGAMPQWGGVDEVFSAMSQEFPSLLIEISEQCEEPYVPARLLRFTGGAQETHHGRVLAPEDVDLETARFLAGMLQANGMDDAAAFILKETPEYMF